MSIQRRLGIIREILLTLEKSHAGMEIVGYDSTALQIFRSALERVIKRYGRESKRVGKYYR